MSLSTSSTREHIVLVNLIRAFYKCSLKFSFEPKDIELLTWEQQQKFINATIKSKTVMKYPVNIEFCRLFLKKLLGYLEPVHEVHDEIYSFLCQVMKCDRQNFCYRHYVIENDFDNLVTIKETRNIVANGTTGMRTWEAALILADWVLNNKNLFNGKKILELGSGVGFTGITVAKYCKVDSITLTDCHDDVLKTICDNIEINFPEMHYKGDLNNSLYTDGTKTLGVMRLDWNNLEDLPKDLIPSIIIGSDLVYDPTILKPLCNVFKVFFCKNKHLEIYVTNILRNEDTYKTFLEYLDYAQFEFEEVENIKNKSVEWDSSIQKYLLRIRLKIM